MKFQVYLLWPDSEINNWTLILVFYSKHRNISYSVWLNCEKSTKSVRVCGLKPKNLDVLDQDYFMLEIVYMYTRGAYVCLYIVLEHLWLWMNSVDLELQLIS